MMISTFQRIPFHLVRVGVSLLLAACGPLYPDLECQEEDGILVCYDTSNPYYRQELQGMSIFIKIPSGEELELDEDTLSADDSEGNHYWVDGIAQDLLTGEILAGEEFNVRRPNGDRDVVEVEVRLELEVR